jgi:hypothetical protein
VTIQIADTLVYEGHEYQTRDFPLELYYEDHPRPEFNYRHSGQWRGYRATWEIEGDTLYLTDIETEWPGRRGLSVAELFPRSGEKVEAAWFSGKIHLSGVRECNAPHHRRDRILVFQSGKLIGYERVDRR